jgi:Putative zincin peptidase
MHSDVEGSGPGGPGPFSVKEENAAVISLSTARNIVLFWLVVPGAGLVLLHYLIWGISLDDIHALLTSPFEAIGAIVLGAILHEALHALGYFSSGAPAKSIRIHFHVKSLTANVSCNFLIPAWKLKLTCLLPLLSLGLGGAVAAMANGSLGLTLWSAFMISSAAGDVAILYAIRSVPPGCPARLHGSEVGCVYYC